MWFDEANPIEREHLQRNPYHWDKFTQTFVFDRRSNSRYTRPRQVPAVVRARERLERERVFKKALNTPLPPSPETVAALEELQFIEEPLPPPLPPIEPRMQTIEDILNAVPVVFGGADPDTGDVFQGPARPPEGWIPQLQGAYTASGKLRRKYRKRGYRKRYSYKMRKLYRDAMAMRKMKSRVFNRIYQVYGKPYRRKSYKRSYRRYRRK